MMRKTANSGAHARGRSAIRPLDHKVATHGRWRKLRAEGWSVHDLEVLGAAPAPIDNDTHADACILLQIIAKTKPERVAEFVSLTGDRHAKMAFLLRHGHFEQPRKTQ